MYDFKPSTDLMIELNGIGIKHSIRTMYNKMLKGRKSPYYNIEEWASETMSLYNMETDDQPSEFWNDNKLIYKALMRCMKECMEWRFIKLEMSIPKKIKAQEDVPF